MRKLVYLVSNFLTGFPNVERFGFEDRKVDLFEAELAGDLSEIVEEPVAEAHVFRREVSGALGRVDVDFLDVFGDWGRR